MEQHDFPELATLEEFLRALRDTPMDEVDHFDMALFGMIHSLHHLIDFVNEAGKKDHPTMDS